MEETTRAFAVLAALTLAVAPVTNGVLEKAVRTADRVILEPADWDREPPEDPPNVTPPEKPPEGNRSFEGPGPRPTCEVETEPVAGWNHPAEPGAPPNRTTDPSQQTFEVNETHIGLGVALEITNLTGELSARVAHEGGEGESFSFDHAAFSGQQEDVNRTSTIPRDGLAEGEWVAELAFRTASYEQLRFVVVRASCAGVQG